VTTSGEILSALSQMTKDLENQYLLVFRPQTPNDIGKHKIEIVSKKSRTHVVRARRGYFVVK